MATRPLTADEIAAQRAAGWLNQAGGNLSDLLELTGYGLAAGTAQGVDLLTRNPRRALNFANNIGLSSSGQPTQAFNPYPALDMVNSWGPPEIARTMGLAPAAGAPATAAGVPAVAAGRAAPIQQMAPVEAVIDTVNPFNLPASIDNTPGGMPMANDFDLYQAANPIVAPGSSPAGGGTQVTAMSPAVAQALTALALDPAVAARVPVQPRPTGVSFRPEIQAGNFYANATQSGLARSLPAGESELDRWSRARVEQRLLPGGRAALTARDVAARADAVQQLRQTPQYLAQFLAARQNTGGDSAAAQALVDQQFLGAAEDPNLALGLVENNTTPALDAALSRQAAAALASGQAQLPVRLSSAAADAGYYGSGILPYGTAPNAPAYLAPGVGGPAAITGLPNVPESFSAPALTQAGGAQATQARADAGEQAIQRLLAAAAGSGSTAALRLLEAQRTLASNDPAVQFQDEFIRQYLRNYFRNQPGAIPGLSGGAAPGGNISLSMVLGPDDQ